jgi:hypothetical protein
MRNFDVLIDKFNGFTSCAEVHIYSQEDKTAIIKVKRRFNIKMDPQEVGHEGIDWIDLARDRDKWRAPVNAVMNLRFNKMRGIS